jgi:hypothetical protein
MSSQKTRPGFSPGLFNSKNFLVVRSLDDQVIDDAVSFIDVMNGAITQAAHRGIVFFPGDVVVSFIQQFLGAVEAAGAVHAGIDRRMIVQILAVINRSALDFFDGFIDFVDGVLFFFIHVMGGGKVCQVSAGMAQIGERVQICRMPSWFIGKTYSCAKGNNNRK